MYKFVWIFFHVIQHRKSVVYYRSVYCVKILFNLLILYCS